MRPTDIEFRKCEYSIMKHATRHLSRVGVAAVGLRLAAPLNAQYPTDPPEPTSLRPLEFPEFQESRLANGLDLLVVENRELPVVSISLRLPAGSALDPVDQEGVASMVAELLTKGTESRSAEDISSAIEGVGGSLNAGAGQDFFSVSSTVLKDHVELAFELIGDVLMNSTFPEEELELARTRTLSALRLEKTQPSALANRFISRALYGEHPYGRRPAESSVSELSREDVVAFAETYLKPESALLVVAGDIDLKSAKRLAQQHLGSWEGSAPTADFPAPPPAKPSEILLVHRPGSEQSNILMGNLTMLPGDPQYYAAVVANRILGGGSAARLFMKLREEKGWTYGSYSSVTRPRDMGRFVANAEVRNEVTDSALTELLKQVELLSQEPVTADEITKAKGYLIGSFPRQIETPQQIANQVSTVKLLGLGKDYLETYRERLAAVETAEIMGAAERLMTPDSAVIVVVGDGQAIYDKLAAIMPVSIIDTDGNPMTRDDLFPTATVLDFDTDQIVTRKDSFQVMVQGNPLGTLVAELVEEDGFYVFKEVTSIPVAGMSQTSAVKFSPDSYTLVSVKQDMQFGPQSGKVDVMVEGGRATGTANTPQGGEVDVDTALEPGVLESNMIQPLLPALPLEDGATFNLKIFSATSGKVRTATLKVLGIEEVTVPAGTFETYKVEIQGLEAPAMMSVSTDSPRRLVRIEAIGQPVVMELVN